MAYPLLIDMAIHQFDLARDLIGSDPVAVYCESFNPSWSWFAGDAAADGAVRVRRRHPVRASPAAGAVLVWKPPGTAAGGSARPAAPRCWDGDYAPVAETADGEQIPAEPGTEPEQIAGSLAEFVTASAHRRRAVGRGAQQRASAWPWSRPRSDRPRPGGGWSSATCSTMPTARRSRTEQRPELAAALASWPSLHEVIGNASRVVSAGELKGELR